tara:strand:- start:362 stop:517 length:156 start_codon:yes stop_codon:yes gene_type:complete
MDERSLAESDRAETRAEVNFAVSGISRDVGMRNISIGERDPSARRKQRIHV